MLRAGGPGCQTDTEAGGLGLVSAFWHVTVAGRERDPILDQASVGSTELVVD